MLVALTAVFTTLFYAANIPVKLAFCLKASDGFGASMSVRVFEGRFALDAARRRLSEGKKTKKTNVKKPSLRVILSIARRLLKHIKLDYLSLELDFGLSDAAGTALAAGFANAVIAAVKATTHADVVAHVKPDFQEAHFLGELSGIVSLRTGHIILAAFLGAIENSGRYFHGQTSD